MKRTKEEAQVTRENIMNKGLTLFARKGYYHTTMEDIVGSLNLTKGAFYGHFESKEDLLKQLLEREFQFISTLVSESFVEHKDEKTLTQNLLHRVIDNFYDNKRFRKMILLTWFRMEIDVCNKVMDDKTTFNEFFIEEVHRILQRALKNKLLKPKVHPYSAALQITAMITGIYRLYFVTHDYLKHKDTAIAMVDGFVESTFL